MTCVYVPIVLDLNCSSTTSYEVANLSLTSNFVLPCSYIKFDQYKYPTKCLYARNFQNYVGYLLFEKFQLFFLLLPLFQQVNSSVPLGRSTLVMRHCTRRSLYKRVQNYLVFVKLDTISVKLPFGSWYFKV